MDQQTYLDELRFHLAGRMPVNEMERVLQYYAGQFAAAQHGAEATAVELGDPRQLADDLVDDYLNLKSEYERRHQKPKKKRFGLFGILGVIATMTIMSNMLFIMRPQRTYPAPSQTIPPMAEEVVPHNEAYYNYNGQSLTSVPGQENVSYFSSISNVNIMVDSAQVEVVTGSEYSVLLFVPEGRAPFDGHYDGGIVTIDRAENYSAIGAGWPRIVITVPAERMLESLHINNQYGDINLDGVGVKGDAYFYSDFGSLTINGASIGTLSSHVNAGNMTITDTDFRLNFYTNVETGSLTLTNVTAPEAQLDLSAGKANLDRCTISALNIYSDIGAVIANRMTINQSLYAHTEVGEIRFTGNLLGSITANSSIGAITINTTLPEEAYTMNLSTDLGSISVDGSKQRGGYLNWGSGGNFIEVYTDIGSVDLNFSVAMPEPETLSEDTATDSAVGAQDSIDQREALSGDAQTGPDA
jgi:Predicted membrane protein